MQEDVYQIILSQNQESKMTKKKKKKKKKSVSAQMWYVPFYHASTIVIICRIVR